MDIKEQAINVENIELEMQEHIKEMKSELNSMVEDMQQSIRQQTEEFQQDIKWELEGIDNDDPNRMIQTDVRELKKALTQYIPEEKINGCVLLVGGKQANRFTKLKDGDQVMMMPPVAGG